MSQEDENQCCAPPAGQTTCCKVEAVVSIDERGQMVLPKEMRDRANINAGDKLAIISWEKEGRTCCLTMIKADDLTGMVKGMLGPLMKDIFQE